jgi:hypothetical protein
MRDDLDNVVDLATHRKSDMRSDVVHTLVCMGLQREIYEHQIDRLKSTNRSLVAISITAYVLGMYCGFHIARSLLQ